LLSKVASTTLTFPFIYFPLSFIAKADKTLCRIYYLSFSANEFINRGIDKEAAFLKYTTLDKVF